MPATVKIYSYHGSSPVGTDVTSANIRFKKADNDTLDTLNRMPIPTIGNYEYSYVKQTALVVAASQSFSLLDTFKFYGDGALPTGVAMFVADTSLTLSTPWYINPLSQVDTILSTPAWANNYAGYQSSPSSAKLSIAGSQLSTSSETKLYTGFLAWQMRIAYDATSGTMTSETATYEYLES